MDGGRKGSAELGDGVLQGGEEGGEVEEDGGAGTSRRVAAVQMAPTHMRPVRVWGVDHPDGVDAHAGVVQALALGGGVGVVRREDSIARSGACSRTGGCGPASTTVTSGIRTRVGETRARHSEATMTPHSDSWAPNQIPTSICTLPCSQVAKLRSTTSPSMYSRSGR